MSGILTWFAFAKAAVADPVTFFDELEVHGYGVPLSFSLLSVSIVMYLSAAARVAGRPTLLQSPPDLLFLLIWATLIGTIGGTALVALWAVALHVSAWINDTDLAAADYQKTLVAVAYSTAAVAFLGWIPLIKLLAPVYAVYLQVRGIERTHSVPKRRAALIVAVPVLLLGGVVVWMHMAHPDVLRQLLFLPKRVAFTIYQLVM